MSDEYKRIIIDGKKYYGQHMMLTATECNFSIQRIDKIKEFLITLVKDIDMVAYGKPIAARFGEGIEIGISGVQLIETSAITLHTNDNSGDLYLDVFSCKQYDERSVIDSVNFFFAPKSTHFNTVYRQ